MLLAALGALSNCTIPLSDDLRILGFASHELSRTRLQKNAFMPTGTQMHTMGVDLYERIISSRSEDRTALDDLQIGIMSLLRYALPAMQ